MFSIVIPTRNRPADLEACLATIAALDYPKDMFEVLVVDDGGGLNAAVIDRARAAMTVRLLTQSQRGPASARNFGVAAARGQYIAFTDDDCAVDRGWLRELERAFESHPDAMIGGGTLSARRSSIFAVASQNIIDFLYDYYESTPNRFRYFASNNVACRRDALVAIGGFDESFRLAAAEDRDLCERWNESGRPFHLERSAMVTHHINSSLARYVKQHFRYGRGGNRLRLARQRRGATAPHEPAGFFARLVTFAIRREKSPRGLALTALAATSQVAYGAGYYAERLLERFRPRLRRPAAVERVWLPRTRELPVHMARPHDG
jgi:GT2 family glycosyltransferase